MLIIDRDYNIENINESGLKLLGKSKEEVIGKKCYQVISGADSPGEGCPCVKSLETKKVESLDWYEERLGKYYSIKSSPIFDENGAIIKFVDLRRDITERKQAEERIEHLNSVLKAIRDVNQVILVEKDRDRLLQKACDALTEARGYDVAWLGFLSDGETFATVKGSGFRKDVARFCEHVMSGNYPPCIKNALARKEMLVVLDKTRECGDCPFKNAYPGKATAIIRVEHADKFFGLLGISLAADVAADDEEKELLNEVTGDIAFALHDMEVEEARKQAEEALKHTALSLQEHVEKLEESKKKIAEAYRLREHFLKETSHRIITPVAIIGGNTDLLLERGNLDGDQKEKIRIIRERNEEVQKLTRDALLGKYLEGEEEEGGDG